jgi:membrane fusion protein (multidrug efflux system)
MLPPTGSTIGGALQPPRHLATTVFSRTHRLMLRARLVRDAGLIVAAVVLLGGWFGWMVLGRVPIYASAEQMKIESEKLPLHIEVPVDGVVVECSLTLGRAVQEGEVLVKLDAKPFELKRDQLQAQFDGDKVTIDALTLELIAQQRARIAVAELAKQTQTAGRARAAAAQTSFAFRAKETAIMEKLHKQALASELDMVKANGDAASLRAQAFAAIAQARVDATTGRVTLTDRDVQIAALEKDLANAKAQQEIHGASLAAAQYEVDRRSVHALSEGTLADVIPCVPGLSVTPSQVLGTLLPHANLHVVSFFRPEDAVGRVRHGQVARLRVDNFPWTQYGTVDAAVEQVGSESRDGLVRAELNITRTNPAIPLASGMTGSAEVEVERISPWHLLLRMSGQRTAKPVKVPPASPTAFPG